MSHIHRTKSLDIINGSDFNSCVTSLEGISEKLRVLHTLLDTAVKTSAVFADDACIPNSNISSKAFETLFEINNELSLLFRTYGTANMTDFVYVCIGGQFVTQLDEEDKHSSA